MRDAWLCNGARIAVMLLEILFAAKQQLLRQTIMRTSVGSSTVYLPLDGNVALDQ